MVKSISGSAVVRRSPRYWKVRSATLPSRCCTKKPSRLEALQYSIGSMLTPEAAWQAIEPYAGPLAAKGVPRWEAAGRHLAKAFHAITDLPAHDVSAMDGYAVAGTVQPGERLPVAGTIAAGEPPGATLAPGHALRIMTGAPLPSGEIGRAHV